MIQCTFFKGFSKPDGNYKFEEIISIIKSDLYVPEINAIRASFACGDKEKADRLKKRLQAFTPSATFRHGRTMDQLDRYNGIVHLDFDHIPDESFDKIRELIKQIPYTRLCFTSPSGKGLKVFIETNATSERHEEMYKLVQQYYEGILGIKSDPACKDITRLCFVSHDPDMYYNPQSSRFCKRKVKEHNTSDQITQSYLSKFNSCIAITQRTQEYIKGNRNNFIYHLACNCNRCGLPEEITHAQCIKKYDLSKEEITKAIKSAYATHKQEFAKDANSAKFAKSANSIGFQKKVENEEDILLNSPRLPISIFENLPGILQYGANAFEDPRERDVFLTSALSILSGCLPNVSGIYDRKLIYANIFSLILAPAASGKGVMKFAEMLAYHYHRKIVEESKEAEKQHKRELSQHQAKERFKKSSSGCELPPEPPPFKVLMIPANSSYAKLLTHLKSNDGSGIICETEADTMVNAFKQEWGNYSELIRKAFHHDKISSSKKVNNEFIEIYFPKLSIVLTGTINQVLGLIKSSEDGLFSRFLFYIFKSEQKWKDVSPKGKLNLTEYFEDLSKQVYEMAKFLEINRTTVELTDEQWNKLNNSCARWLEDSILFNGEDAASIVKRLGLTIYRLCMLFSAIRKFEQKLTVNTIFCSDHDFQTAIRLIETFLQHSILVLNNLPRQSQTVKFQIKDNKRQFLEALPEQFTTAEAVEIGKKFSLKYSTVTHFLPKLVPEYFSQPKPGYYIKRQNVTD